MEVEDVASTVTMVGGEGANVYAITGMRMLSTKFRFVSHNTG